MTPRQNLDQFRDAALALLDTTMSWDTETEELFETEGGALEDVFNALCGLIE